jgi:phosphinothricin acetyltransferase
MRRHTSTMERATVDVAAASVADLAAINDIYNHYVVSTAVTFDVEPTSMAWRREWFTGFAATGPHRLLVARRDGHPVGYADSARHRRRAAYDPSVETSVYVAPDLTGRGVGTALYEALLRELESEDVHRAFAGITMPNPASVRLHERFGFRHVGTFTEQGRKLGRYWDVAWFERPVPLDAR